MLISQVVFIDSQYSILSQFAQIRTLTNVEYFKIYFSRSDSRASFDIYQNDNKAINTNIFLTCNTCIARNIVFFEMNKINWYSLFTQACVIFTFVTFLGYASGYFFGTSGFASFKLLIILKIILIFFYFLFSFILTIRYRVSRFHLFLLVIVADLLSNYFGMGKGGFSNYFPQLIFNIILYFISMFLGNYAGNKYLSKKIK